MTRVVRSLALASLALLALGTHAAAQAGRPGWIGIAYETRSAPDGEVRVVITEVRTGSPAEAAGVRAGDRLIAIEGIDTPEELMTLSKRIALRAGQLVDMRVQRNGRPLALRVRAAERPDQVATNVAWNFAFPADSMVETMVRAMDSLRVQLLQGSEPRVVARVRTAPEPAVRPGQPPAPAAPRTAAVAAPFEFFVFRGEQHDSLVREMERLNQDLAELQTREAERVQELRRSRRGQRAEEQDRTLVRLRREIQEVTRRSSELRSAMAEAARVTAGWEYLVPPVPEASDAPSPRREEPYRPLTPYLLGSNRVAGAQLVEVQPELGSYFGVEGGVLVVDVSPGTPAAIAGIRPGDVVTRIDQVNVRTVDDFRLGVSRSGETLPLTLMRRGGTVQVLLRRR